MSSLLHYLLKFTRMRLIARLEKCMTDSLFACATRSPNSAELELCGLDIYL